MCYYPTVCKQQLIRKGRQRAITGSNLNLLKYFCQTYKTVYLICLKIPSGAQIWPCELLTSQSLSHFTVEVRREWGQKRPGVPKSEYSELSVGAFGDGCLNPYTFSSWSIKGNAERESDLRHVKQSVSVSVASATVPMNPMNADPLTLKGKIQFYITCIY